MTYKSTKVDQTWRSNESNLNRNGSHINPAGDLLRVGGLVSKGPAPRSKIDQNTPLEEVNLQGGYHLYISGRGEPESIWTA